MTITRLSLGLVLLSLALEGCWFRDNSQEVVESVSVENLSNNQTLLENTAEGVRLTVPSGWTVVDDLRPDADIYTTNEAEEAYVMVLADEQNSLVSQFSLEDNASQYRRILARQMDSYEGQSATDLTSVNGLEAVQYEVRGQIDGVPIVYLHTTVKGEDNYYQVIGWTKADRYPAQKAILQAVITSFRGS